MAPEERAAAASALAAARAARGPEAPALIAAAHDRCQGAPLAHAQVHALCLRAAWRGGAPIRAAELGQLLLAPAASLIRRASGLRAGEPGGPSLAATWAGRRSG